MKNITQLAKLARRIPRVVRRSMQKLAKKGLSDNEVKFYRGRIVAASVAKQLLDQELIRRNIGGTPFRNATPHKKQRRLEAALLGGKSLAGV